MRDKHMIGNKDYSRLVSFYGLSYPIITSSRPAAPTWPIVRADFKTSQAGKREWSLAMFINRKKPIQQVQKHHKSSTKKTALKNFKEFTDASASFWRSCISTVFDPQLEKKESSTGVSLQFYETFRMFLQNIYERLLRQAHMATSKKSQFYCLNII